MTDQVANKWAGVIEPNCPNAKGQVTFTRPQRFIVHHAAAMTANCIGMRLPEVNLPSGQMSLTNTPTGSDPNWGLVAELPNANLGNGPALDNDASCVAGQRIRNSRRSS